MSLASQRLHSRGLDRDRQLPALEETEADVLVNRHDAAERDLVGEFPALMAEPLRTVRQALGRATEH